MDRQRSGSFWVCLDGRPVGKQPFLTDLARRQYPEPPTLV